MYVHQLVYGADGACDDRTAIIAVEGEISYKALWRQVSRCRALLEGAGVAAGDPVALHLPRSANYVACLIATLAAQAIAVPVDPDLPEPRVTGMLESAGAKVVLSDRATVGSCDQAGRRWLIVDWTDEPDDTSPIWTKARSEVFPDPEQAAAIILFTSGSTGTPKGVLLHHAGVVNRLQWGQRMYALDNTDRVLHKASIGFDASLHEIFAPLIAGAILVIAPPGVQFDARAITRLIQEAEVTTAHFVPSVLSHVADEDDFAGCTSLRRIFCGGEALRMDLVRRVTDLLDCALFNQYGPTETSISVTYWDCRRDYAGDVAPLGFPIDAVSCQVLDEDRQPMKAGEVGEIWVSGVAVGLGYLEGVPHAERFQPDPDHAGRRIYRTGDLGVLTPDGYLEFRGRVDDQVKVRGVRVEPDEVAHCLLRHPMVLDAAVVNLPSAAGGVRLIAFVAPRRRNSPIVNGLQRIQLADGTVVATPTPDEAMFLHRQIFHEREYARFGVDVREGDVVLDVGANIGIFSLWAHRRALGVKVVAVEPNPDVLPYLELNLELAEADYSLFPFAVDEEADTVELTSFPQLTYLSGIGDRRAPAQRLIDSFRAAQARRSGGGADGEADDVHGQLSRRLATKHHRVRALPLSAIIESAQLDRIDLLKINTEGSELAVLRSLGPEHWARIGQVCVEVERASVVGPKIRKLLIDAGFAVNEVADWNVGQDADVVYIYATRDRDSGSPRPAAHEKEAPNGGANELIMIRGLRHHLHTQLPAQMQPDEIVLLEHLPRLANGKLDKAGLPHLASSRRSAADAGPAETDAEDWLVLLWRQALGIDTINEEDNFLALGGHSLIAMQICAAVRRKTGAEIPVASCMTAATLGHWLDEVRAALALGSHADE